MLPPEFSVVATNHGVDRRGRGSPHFAALPSKTTGLTFHPTRSAVRNFGALRQSR
jgi:hypothetical protein